ncbi:hypothetical protein VIA_002251 [Vibrio orientalis CIP 102891 = ATCC 33934]|uniref:Uncharacterized protein n=1 Tax=Vibrio orientalis CIP 102891 = ATCC 33934 TaxID=675816 RepID=A0ABP2GY86_VIBOR|nr:hypothetical protein VIA_002251 [Vibrio orientalis CIP 102891 = ATCC 33934]
MYEIAVNEEALPNPTKITLFIICQRLGAIWLPNRIRT